MSATGKSVTIRCKGHPNIRASHAKTFELTRDPSITSAGTCIIGVEAEYDEAALLSLRGAVRITLRCGEYEDTASARINPKFAAGAPLIFRRMPTPEPRTFCVGADKGSHALDRDLIAALQQPGAELEVTVAPDEKAEQDGDGILYLVGTPIGNLDDVSPRALSVLQSVDLILCEDTRTTKSLLSGFGLDDLSLTAYHDHNERDRAPDIVRRLRDGARIALVSEAGMPTVSDPGFHLVRAAREEGLAVTTVPGPDAVTTALSLAGLPTDDFRFIGFLPRKPTLRKRRFEELTSATYTTVCFEAPHRIDKALEEAAEILPDRPMALCRNLTKFGEKVLTGTAAEILSDITEGEAVNGELVLLIGGAAPADEGEAALPVDGDAVERMLESLVAAGLPTKALGDAYAKAMGIPRRDGFNRVLEMKKAAEE
ncbi:MAG: 16S rRNA (cytidine(1402)-2'-O)-methyltransferase [Pseudomonadota bacterium]|nr:16S rRNA (cytidine(1402)-2'-O)-methyltransferase [Pseudomonadota bacterium]